MRRNAIFWGLILVIGGFLLLLDNLGLLPVGAWNIFWPLLVIFWGVSMLWGTLFRKRLRSEHVNIPLEGASQAQVLVRHGAGRLSVHSGASNGDLVEGNFGGGLDLVTRRSGDTLYVELNASQPSAPIFWSGDMKEWDVSVNPEIPMRMEFKTGANEAVINLSDLKVTDLRLQSGASSTELTLPANAGYTRAEIETGAAAVRVRVPAGVAARINSKSGLASVEVDSTRFPRRGDAYESEDYATAENRVDLDIRTGVGSVDIR